MSRVAILLLAGATAATTAQAGHRVVFRGSEQVALQAAGVRAAGFAGLPAATGNLSASCPTCVPGGSSSANFGASVPNQIVTFLHPYTNRAVTVPLTLPVGRPQIIVRRTRIVYDYGLFNPNVVVIFKPDGLVEVRYR